MAFAGNTVQESRRRGCPKPDKAFTEQYRGALCAHSAASIASQSERKLCRQKETTMRNAWRMAVVLFLLTFTASQNLFAQSDLGTISGFVKDTSGATVANA